MGSSKRLPPDPAGLKDVLAGSEDDPLLPDAIKLISQYERVGPGLLQLVMLVGRERATRMIDQLERRGFLGPADGSDTRKVLVGRGDDAAPEAG